MSIFDDYREEEAQRLQPGDYRVAIVGVEETKSKNGDPMLVVTLQLSGSKLRLKHYIVKNEYFNRNMTDLYDSFGIARGSNNIISWAGSVGGARIIENEEGYLRVRRLLPPERCDKLPPWEGELPQKQEVHVDIQKEDEFGDLPF